MISWTWRGGLVLSTILETPMARLKTAYRKKYFALIVAMARKGNTNSEIAQALKIHRDTLYDWFKKFEGLREAADVAREGRIREVEAAFFKRALGYTTQIREVAIDPTDPKREKILSVKVRDVERPPSVSAGMFILANKLSGEYKNRQEIEHSGRIGMKLFVGWTPDEWDAIDAEAHEVLPGGNGNGDGEPKQITGGNGKPHE
jgi:hypothetical protein